jgi:hypothetical protein
MSKVAAGLSTQQVVQALVQQVKAIELTPHAQGERVSSGSPDLDRILPERGFARGSLIEWLSSGPGSGTSTLALRAAVQACRSGQALVVVDRQQAFYLPGAVSWGADPARLVIVRPGSDQEEAWAIDQILRCPAVGAMLCWPRRSDDHTYRRWQLAAETGGTLGFLVRPVAARSQPSWAEVRLLVEPLNVSRRVRATHLSIQKERNNHGEDTEKAIELDPQISQRDTDKKTASMIHLSLCSSVQSVDTPNSSPCLRNSHSAFSEESQTLYEQTLVRRLRVQIVRCRWGKSGRSAEVVLENESTALQGEGRRR